MASREQKWIRLRSSCAGHSGFRHRRAAPPSSRKVFAPLGYVPQEVTQYGENIHLDGLQALSYARLRKIDSDFQRTGRQAQRLRRDTDAAAV